jgi:FixJ family two-component response regulator
MVSVPDVGRPETIEREDATVLIPAQTVVIVDDGPSESLKALLRSAGWRLEAAASVDDLARPDQDGITLLRRLTGDRTDMSVIMITVEESGAVLSREAELQTLRARYASMSIREREVMALVVAGFANKRVGDRLGIAEITVKAHRGRVMRKMGADSLAELVRIAMRLRMSLHAPGVSGVQSANDAAVRLTSFDRTPTSEQRARHS